MTEKDIIKKIVEGELKLTMAVRNGHKPYIGDKYQPLRTEVEIFRCLYFGYDSKFCKHRK